MAASEITTVELAGKTLPCYQEGEETYILYANLMKEFELAENISLSTQQRRKNKIASTDQHCPSQHLNCLKDAGLVSRGAKNVAVLTTNQAQQLLQLYKVPVETNVAAENTQESAREEDTPSIDPTVPNEQQDNPQPQSSSALELPIAIESDSDGEQPGPPPAKAARLTRKMQLNLELHKDVDLQMKQLASFWTKDINHKRGGQPLSATTAGKTKERLLSELPVDALYMYSNGYCTCKIHIYWSQTLTCSIPGVFGKAYAIRSATGVPQQPTNRGHLPKLSEGILSTPCTPAIILPYHAYVILTLHTCTNPLLYLQEERKVQPGTLAGYCQVINMGLKFLAVQEGLETADAQQYIRSLTSRFQKEASTSPKSWQQLSWENKWLDWEEILKVVKDQQELYESQVRPLDRAVESQKYATLLLYTTVPPGRAKEYRTLRIQRHSGPFKSNGKDRSNLLHYGPQVAMLQVGEYKNAKHLGTRHIDLVPVEVLTSHLHDFLERDRPLLLKGNPDRGYLFVVSNS